MILMKTSSPTPERGTETAGASRVGGIAGLGVLALIWWDAWPYAALVLVVIFVACLTHRSSRGAEQSGTRKIRKGSGIPAPWD
jgi:hypothetical protein